MDIPIIVRSMNGKRILFSTILASQCWVVHRKKIKNTGGTGTPRQGEQPVVMTLVLLHTQEATAVYSLVWYLSLFKNTERSMAGQLCKDI